MNEVEKLFRIPLATEAHAQRLTQAIRLGKQFETAQNVSDREVTIDNSSGGFSFELHNQQRATFYNMLRGRLRSMPMEGLGYVGYELIGGRIRVFS